MLETKWKNAQITTPPPSMEVLTACHAYRGIRRGYYQEGKFFDTWHMPISVDVWTEAPNLKPRFVTFPQAARVIEKVIEKN